MTEPSLSRERRRRMEPGELVADVYRCCFRATETFAEIAVELAYLLGALATGLKWQASPDNPGRVRLLALLREHLPADHAVWGTIVDEDGDPVPPGKLRVQVDRGCLLKLNCPDWFARPDFRGFLDQFCRSTDGSRKLATWHTPGAPDEYSDVFSVYDQGEGSDTDAMPEDVWREIRAVAEQHGFRYGIVWLTNIGTADVATTGGAA